MRIRDWSSDVCSSDLLELDMSVIGFEGIFQDIVQRSALDYVEVEAAWTCSKMRPDGFGGAATLITADDIETVSTAGWLVVRSEEHKSDLQSLMRTSSAVFCMKIKTPHATLHIL